MRTLALGLCALSVPALAAPYYETVLSSCYEFPEIREHNIVNVRGDQGPLKASDYYGLSFEYKVREHVKLIKDINGKVENEEFDRWRTNHQHFRGDTVASVKNQAETFVRSSRSQECSKR